MTQNEENITIEIKENTSYKELAEKIANIIKDDYGTHNIEPFLKELNKKLKN
jgi:hypothetical protein